MSDDYTNPQDPEGCRAVIPLSDGIRIILADGTVAHLTVTTDDGDELIEVTGGLDGGVFGGIDHDTRVEVGIISDHEAAQHPMVQEALEDLGFWGESDNEDTQEVVENVDELLQDALKHAETYSSHDETRMSATVGFKKVDEARKELDKIDEREFVEADS